MEMNFNKKGFTLVELLAVVVILLAISLIAVSSISAAIERNKQKEDNMKKSVIVEYAKLYWEEHKNSLSKNYPDGGCIMLSELDLSDNEKVDSNGDSFAGGVRFSAGGKSFSYDESCQ